MLTIIAKREIENKRIRMENEEKAKLEEAERLAKEKEELRLFAIEMAAQQKQQEDDQTILTSADKDDNPDNNNNNTTVDTVSQENDASEDEGVIRIVLVLLL